MVRKPPLLRVSRWIERSAVNGPGERFVLWVQGCPFRCPGCWNPDTWPRDSGELVDPRELLERILTVDRIEGVTFTGGEPFAQAEPLAWLAEQVRRAGLSVMVFTGFEIEKLRTSSQRRLLRATDLAVAGRYVDAQQVSDQPWLGSANQTIRFLSGRYSAADIPAASSCEVHLHLDGRAVLTGFPEVGVVG